LIGRSRRLGDRVRQQFDLRRIGARLTSTTRNCGSVCCGRAPSKQEHPKVGDLRSIEQDQRPDLLRVDEVADVAGLLVQQVRVSAEDRRVALAGLAYGTALSFSPFATK
jgi:hypothetical protein